MSRTSKIFATAAATSMLTALAVTYASTAEAADNCTFNNPRTIATVTVRSRNYELRAGNNHCAWGRILNASPGDYVWVDRSSDGGRHWEQLSITRVDTGGSAHTDVFNDLNPLQMRACGHAGGYPSEVACTIFW